MNDATATYHNPAALTLLQNSQIIGLGTFADFNSNFTGQSRQILTGFTQSGNSANQTHYYLPSIYLGVPVNDKFVAGLAIISNFFNRDLDPNSILRYAQSSNNIKNVDLVPAVGIKLNEYFAIGAGINFSKANFILDPISGSPSLLIPDNQSHNESKGSSWGGDVGFLYHPIKSTVIGLNYRSANTYHQRGSSVLKGIPQITSDNYHFNFWTPARSILSINQFVTPKFGLIGTIQYIQWGIFKNVTIYDFATQIGSESIIIPQATIPYFLHNSWLLTLGSHYRISPKSIIRVAGTYNQSPGNVNYQISNGDSIILGSSIGYDVNKNITLDVSYAHAFIGDGTIHIASKTNLINGINTAVRDSISLKITIKGSNVQTNDGN